MFYVYILQSLVNEKIYVGQTNNLKDRLFRHNNGEVNSTKTNRPWKFIWFTDKTTRAEAMKLEKYLKSLSNKRKIEFISKYSD